MSLPTYLRAAIREAKKHTDDKRKLIVFGHRDALGVLRSAAQWQAPPACFEQARPIMVGTQEAFIVGSFDGVPVAEADSAPVQGGAALVLSGKVVGGVSLISAGLYAAWGVDENAPGFKTYQLEVDAGAFN